MMKHRMILIAALALPLALGGCTTLENVYNDLFGANTPTQANAAGAAEAAYTVAADVADGYVKSGKCNASCLVTVEKYNTTAYNAVVAMRQAVANGDSATIAAAISLANSDIAQLNSATGNATTGATP